MHKAILLGIIITGISGVASFSLIPGSLSANCIATYLEVPATESPDYDENGNGTICKYSRNGSPEFTFYQDDN